MLKKTTTVFLILLSSLFLLGNIWFWKDDQGIRHYSNVGPPIGKDAQQLQESREITKKLTASQNAGYTFRVIKVFDGDTIRVSGLDLVFTVRLAGIDAPEIGYGGRPSQPFSRKSQKHLDKLVAGKLITLKSHGIGGYNRQLAEIFLEGRNINLEMIRAGLAEVYRGRLPKGLDGEAYRMAESRSKAQEKGMWRQGGQYESPRKWRKDHPRKKK